MLEKIYIAVSSDDNYIVPTAVMLKSVSVNTISEVCVFFLENALEEKSKIFLQKNFENTNIKINFIKINTKRFNNFKTNDRIPLETYFRLLIPELLPHDIHKIIYLDGDLIVRCDIKYLWSYKINNDALLAVRDMWIGTQFVSSERGVLSYKELNIPENAFYFNAGVLVMNLKKWREQELSERIFHYLVEYQDKVIYHDQDGLNAVLWNKWSRLPEEWNVMGIVFSDDRQICCLDEDTYNFIRKNPKIVHFSGPCKPWDKDCNNPYKEEYFYYKKQLKY